jgi:hypothetical protein
MRVFFASICTIAVVALIAYSSRARAAGGALTGKMAAFNYLIGGSWNCSIKMPPMDGRPALTNHATVTFDVLLGNVFHAHQSAAYYSADSYYGYSWKSNLYWITTADSTGAYRYATSSDGETYTRNSSSNPFTINVRTTYAKVNSSTIAVHEVLPNGGHQEIIDRAQPGSMHGLSQKRAL